MNIIKHLAWRRQFCFDVYALLFSPSKCDPLHPEGEDVIISSSVATVLKSPSQQNVKFFKT